MTTHETTPARPGRSGRVTVSDLFAWLDTLRGWDVATHLEYQRLRDLALRDHEALATERDALRAAYLAAENWTYDDDVYCFGEPQAIKMRDERRQRIGVTPGMLAAPGPRPGGAGTGAECE